MDKTNRSDLMGEITACKNLLGETDYQLIKMLESMTSATTATGLIAMLKSFASDFKEVVADRIKWRETINECEEALAKLDAAEAAEQAAREAAEAAERAAREAAAEQAAREAAELAAAEAARVAQQATAEETAATQGDEGAADAAPADADTAE